MALTVVTFSLLNKYFNIKYPTGEFCHRVTSARYSSEAKQMQWREENVTPLIWCLKEPTLGSKYEEGELIYPDLSGAHEVLSHGHTVNQGQTWRNIDDIKMSIPPKPKTGRTNQMNIQTDNNMDQLDGQSDQTTRWTNKINNWAEKPHRPTERTNWMDQPNEQLDKQPDRPTRRRARQKTDGPTGWTTERTTRWTKMNN